MNLKNSILLMVLGNSLKNYSNNTAINTVIITSSLALGGAEKALFNLCNTQLKHQIYIINLSSEQFFSRKLNEIGIEVYNCKLSNIFNFMKEFIKIIYLIYKINPKNIQTWMYHADFLSIPLKIFFPFKKFYWGLRNGSMKLNKKTVFIVNILSIFSYFVPHKIISCANSTTSMHISKGYCKKKMLTINNGIDTNIYFKNTKLRDDFRKKFFLKDNDLIICMVARWHPQKDHRTVFDSIKRLKKLLNLNFYLVLAGTGIDKSNNELIFELEKRKIIDNVMLMGEVDDIVTIYNAADINILCSTEGEGFPNVLAEAMSCGTPCISTNSGDAAKIIDKYGWLINEKNTLDLTNTILDEVQRSKNKNDVLINSNNSINHIKLNYSYKNMINKYCEAWNINPI